MNKLKTLLTATFMFFSTEIIAQTQKDLITMTNHGYTLVDPKEIKIFNQLKDIDQNPAMNAWSEGECNGQTVTVNRTNNVESTEVPSSTRKIWDPKTGGTKNNPNRTVMETAEITVTNNETGGNYKLSIIFFPGTVRIYQKLETNGYSPEEGASINGCSLYPKSR